jgi:adenylosuccinate synthase
VQHRKINLVVDGQFGSCGKGAIAGYLAWKHRPGVLSTTNMANAGHTVVDVDGKKHIAKALPSPAILGTWYPYYQPRVVVGAGAAFGVEQLYEEAAACGLCDSTRLLIHPRAGVITAEQKQRENSLNGGTKHIASTMQGCGAFASDKIMRKPGLTLARDVQSLNGHVAPIDGFEKPLPLVMMNLMRNGTTILHEGSQGFSLDINHGCAYPACTSRQCTALQSVADLGINHTFIGDVYLVIRPYPIRVGNVVENGQTVGHSGGWYPDQEEIDWKRVAFEAGMPPTEADGLYTRELTTVTKRLRRVATFSPMQLELATRINGATRIALNFSNYLDWSVYGVNTADRLTQPVRDFIHRVEDIAQIPVTLVGTGPALNHVVEL